MTTEEINAIRAALIASKRVKTDGGEVEERDVKEIEKAYKLLNQIEADGEARPSLARVGRYRRRYE